MKFKPVKKLKKFERHNYGGGRLLSAATDLPVHWRQRGLLQGSTNLGTIHRVKWRHSSVVTARSPFCGATLCVVKWRRFVSRFSNKIQSVGYKNVRIITILLWKWCHNKKHLAELVPQNGEKNSWHRYDIRNYVTVTLCIAPTFFRLRVDNQEVVLYPKSYCSRKAGGISVEYQCYETANKSFKTHIDYCNGMTM